MTYIFPLTVIVVIYYRIVAVLRQREVARFGDPHKHSEQPNKANCADASCDKQPDTAKHDECHNNTELQNPQALAVRKRNERTTKLVMIVVLLFAICLLPLQVGDVCTQMNVEKS